MNTILQQIRQEAPKHGNLLFWSWNDRLEEGELRKQIRNMKELGVRGFFMHARGGLEVEYLSEEWFRCVNICIDEAKKQGLEAWAYDENGWPSGFAGGALLQEDENLACYLTYEETDRFPAPRPDILGVYCLDESGCHPIREPQKEGLYGIVYRHRDHSYTDIMNPEVTKKFLRATHEVYREKIDPSDFGSTMPGFFTDEPQYYRYQVCWSDTFPEAFEKAFGYSILSGLPALFRQYKGAEEFRHDYHLLCHHSYIDHFVKVIYDWCNENGVQLTGHSVEEWSLAGQMMCCGGIMPFYLYQHIPGIDYLGRVSQNTMGSRQLGSVCAQTGKKEALSEMFACCGWDVTPRELKSIADQQFVAGVNMSCGHLYAYSERGQRKRDYPCHYSAHNPWQTEQKDFERYFSHLGAALSLGKEEVDTLVLSPIRTAYLHYRKMVPHVIQDLDDRLSETIEALDTASVPYHWGDESILAMLAHAENGVLTVGECQYRQVILPYCETLDRTTVSLLLSYVKTGGKLLILGNTPSRIDGKRCDVPLSSNMTWEELMASRSVILTYEKKPQERPLLMQLRHVDGQRLLYITNTAERTYQQVAITVKNCKGLSEIKLHTLTEEPTEGKRDPDGSLTVYHDFAPSASCLLRESGIEPLPYESKEKVEILSLPTCLTFRTKPENVLPLDRAEVSYDGVTFLEERPIERIRDNLLFERYEGRLTLRYRFLAGTQPSHLLAAVEPMRNMTVSVNGYAVQAGEEKRLDPHFLVYDIASHITTGRNEIEVAFDYWQDPSVYRVLYGDGTETLRNSLVFQTEIEAIYLYGDFAVEAVGGIVSAGKTAYRAKGPFRLIPQRDTVELSAMAHDGYPFFAGTMEVEAVHCHKNGDPTLFKPGGRFAVCHVTVNGISIPSTLFETSFELAPYLKEGENQIRLSLTFSNRNLLGPHHRREIEPFYQSPNTFSFEKEWLGGDTCRDFEESYALIRLGIGF